MHSLPEASGLWGRIGGKAWQPTKGGSALRRAFKSLFTIIAVSVVAIGATMAVMFDTETVAGNTFTAGQLDLGLEEVTMPFSVSDILPGDSGEGKVTLTSLDGSVDGNLSVAFTNYSQAENGCLEPEVEAGDSGTNCGAGDLGLALELAIFLDVNQDGVYNEADGDIELEYSGNTNTTDGLNFARANAFGTDPVGGDEWEDVLQMSAGDTVDLVVMWRFPHNQYVKPDAIFMTDTLSFDLVATLAQLP